MKHEQLLNIQKNIDNVYKRYQITFYSSSRVIGHEIEIIALDEEDAKIRASIIFDSIYFEVCEID